MRLMGKTPWRYTNKDLDKSIELQMEKNVQDPLLQTWFNFNHRMDK